MFDFGIQGYQPAWQNGVASVMASHGDRLRALVGRRLTNAWLVWDAEYDEWFADCPVVFDFDGSQVEINHQKFDDLSLTWNTVRPDLAVFWSDTFDLSWRDDAIPALAALQGQTLQTADLLEWTGGDMAHGAPALGFGFGSDYVTVHNALDENGLEFGPPRPEYRRHQPVAAYHRRSTSD